MAARPIWRGQIRLALVSIPVELYPATKSGAQIQFHQVHEPTGKRIKYEKVVPGVGPVDRDEIVKGYEVNKDEYVVVSDEELKKIAPPTATTMEILQFVRTTEVDSIPVRQGRCQEICVNACSTCFSDRFPPEPPVTFVRSSRPARSWQGREAAQQTLA